MDKIISQFKVLCLSLILIISGLTAFAQKSFSRAEYIDMYKYEAMKSMREYKIPASITLAQGMLESGNGNSELALKSNNHFGIKCHGDAWSGKRTYHDDDKKGECFRVYENVYDSYKDHAIFLQKPRYAKCFDLKITDYKGWAHGLKKAGYATNPKYPALLIKLIEDNNLTQYDDLVLKGGNIEPEQDVVPEAAPEPTQENDDLNAIALTQQISVKVSENKVKYIIALPNWTIQDAAKAAMKGSWEIRRYNDLDKKHTFKGGERIYIQPKRKKGTQQYHDVKKGETLWSISQQYGIKMKALMKKNHISKNDTLKPGMRLYLQGTAPER